MEQKQLRAAPRLALWLLVGLLAVVTAQASSISLKNSSPSYRGCIAACTPKDNSIYSSAGLSSLWRKSQQEAYPASAHFQPGKTYTYRVHTWTAALTSFATEQQQQEEQQVDQDYQAKGERLAELKATAWITPLSECEVSMQLKDIDLSAGSHRFDAEEQAAFIAQLQNPILFGYSHGVVTEVCTDSEDDDDESSSPEVLNLKKSIISALQTIPSLAEVASSGNAYPVKVIESDVNGDCQTEYTVSKQSGAYYLIEKEKNLATGCENAPRQQAMFASWKNALLSHSANQKAFCLQKVSAAADRQLVSAQCQSAHTLNAPGLGAHMDIDVIANVALEAGEVFDVASRAAEVPQEWRRHAPRLMMSSPVIVSPFSFSKDGKKMISKKSSYNGKIIDGRVQLKSVLDSICEDMVAHGRRPTTRTVTLVQELAQALSQSSHQDVSFVWKSIVQSGKISSCSQDEKMAKKLKDIFVDTAASVMNAPSAAIVRDELTRYIEQAQQMPKERNQFSQRARYLAVVASFAAEPTPEAIRALLPELLEKVEDSHVILSLTALLKKASWNIEQNQIHQQQDPAFIESLYQTVLRKVTELLSKKGAEAEADIVRLLTALENIDARTVVAGQERLIKLATDKRLPRSVRVAAIKSLVHIEMVPALRQTLLAIFADRADSNEARLAAYRTLMHSAVSVSELAHIRRVIEVEEKSSGNADIHNYVCSHQKNLRSSEDARKRRLLPAGAPLFPEPQSVANIALSRNFEYSSINEKTAVGAIIEADLIMEAESRVPRSITFNLTVPVGEQQIPVIEVTVRQAGLEEAVIRRLQAIRDIKSPAHALRELGRLVRMSTSGSKKDHQKKKYQTEEEEEQQKKKVQIFINIDGKNVFLWDSIQCGQEHGSSSSAGGVGEEFESILLHLYRRLPITLDETMVVMPLRHRVRLPTASGIPVTFQLNSTIIVSYEADIKGIVQSGAESRLEAHIKPTIVVETGVGLVADLPYGQPQQRVAIINRQVSSPTFHLKTSYRAESRQFKAKFLLPEREQIIARYETEFIQTADAMDQPQQQLKKKSSIIKSSASSSGGVSGDEIFQALNAQLAKSIRRRRAEKSATSGVFYRAGKSAEVCAPALEQLTGFTYCVQHFDVEDLKESFRNDNGEGKPKLVYLSQVKLVKTDQSMEGLEFGLTLPAQLFTPEATADEVKFVLHYDTPNSAVNRRLNAELALRLPQSTAEHFIVRLDVDSPLKKFAGQIRVQNERTAKGIKVELTTDRAERQFLFEATALFKKGGVEATEVENSRAIKLQLRLQPSARSSMSTFEGDFSIAHQQQQNAGSNKQKVSAKLVANEKKVLEIAFVKAGRLVSLDQDCKASLTVGLDLLGAQLQYSSMLNKVAATGTIKSSGELKYNRRPFLAIRSSSRRGAREQQQKMEGIGYQLQFTGFNQLNFKRQEAKKVFLHWALQSTQFPALKQELTYNMKAGKAMDESFEQEFIFKWSTEEEKRIRFAQELKQLANSRTREQKLQATAELEISPLSFHHDAKFIIDVPAQVEENSSSTSPSTMTAELKTTNRKSGQITCEARWMHSILSSSPLLKAIYEGDLAIGSDRWFVHSVRNSIQEVKAGHFEGKARFALKIKHDLWMPNADQKVQLKYSFALRQSPADRVPLIAAHLPGSHVWNLYARLINTVDRFENQMEVDDAYFGRLHQRATIVCNAEETCTSQWAVERGTTQKVLVYKGETERNLRQKTFKIKVEAGPEYLSAFGIEINTQLTEKVKMVEVKVANRRFAHQSRILIDGPEKKVELRCQTTQDQKVTFELDGKSVAFFKVAQLKLRHALIEADIDLANLQTPALIRQGAFFRTLFELERWPAEDSTIQVEIKLPRAELEHRVDVRSLMKSARKIEYTAETRHHGRNLFKTAVHLQPKDGGVETVSPIVSVSAQYKNGYTAELKLKKPEPADRHQHQLELSYRVEPKQITHKSVARWYFNGEKAMSKPTIFGSNSYRLPFTFRLISLDTKSHLGSEAIFDLIYRCNEQTNPAAEYAHELLFSGRSTHAELKLSRFGFDYDNARYAPKAFFTLKTKNWLNSGASLEHTTELKEVSLERRSLTITSRTVRRGEPIAEVDARLVYQTGQQSTIKVHLPSIGRQLTAQFVPFSWIEVHCNVIGDAAWKHTLRLERSPERRHWEVKLNCVNSRKGDEQWSAHLSHQCDQQTSLQLESPIVRGVIEVQIPAKKLRIDLKGGAGYEHRFEGQLDRSTRKLTIRSTTSRQAKTIAFIDAELYATLDRASTLKLELEQPIIAKSELAPFKLAITCDPKAAWELSTSVGDKWKHECSVKRLSPRKISIHSETRKHGQTVARLEVSELSPKKAVFHCSCEPEKIFSSSSNAKWAKAIRSAVAPFDVKGTVDLEEREVALQAHSKRSDRLVKFEAKAKDALKNIHVECSWDAKRAPAKRALIQMRVQDRASSPERLVATIRGDLIDRPFNIAIDVPRRGADIFRRSSEAAASFNIEAEMKSRSGEPMAALKIARAVAPQTGDCRSTVELRKGDFVLVKAETKVTGFAQAQSQVAQKKHFIVKVESDLKAKKSNSNSIIADLLNGQIEMSRECTYKQCQTKAAAQLGATEQSKKSIQFEGANVSDALRGQLVISHNNNDGQQKKQTIKFEFIKPESKLQINAFNQAGRQVDVNVDLARPLQKKFQVVSFVPSIPTVDIEAAYGENSRLVLQVSFQEEKKLELALSWFGQWRRDFKLEALFKCFSSPALEMLVTSRHPAGQDEIEAMLKVAGEEWAAKLSRTFDESRANWNTRALIKANGVKKVELVVEATTRAAQSSRIVKTYKVHLDGVRQATGHVTVHLRQKSLATILEMIQVEVGKDAAHPRQATLELFFGHEQQPASASSKQTGVKVTIAEKPFFGLVHITNAGNSANSQNNKRTSLIRLELPEEIEYVLRNEIEYEQKQQQWIKSIKSELKKKSQPVPIYQTVINFENQAADDDMKVMRIEVRSSSFSQAAPVKQMVIRYNFRPKVCHQVEQLQQPQSFSNYANYEEYQQKMIQKSMSMKKVEEGKKSFPYGEAKCWRVELIAGDLVNYQQKQGNQINEGGILRIAAEYIKAPVAGSFHFNRTVAFRMESSKPAHRSINCQLIGHLSPRSFGLLWANQNRHGQQKSGMIYADKVKTSIGGGAQQQMINIYVREQNAHQPSRDFIGELHFAPARIAKTLSIGAQFDQAKLRRWIIGELPTLREMVQEEGKSSGAGSLRKKLTRALKEELAHKMATLKEAYDAELAQPLMAEAKAVGEQLQASEEQLLQELVAIARRANFPQHIEKLLAMIDLEAALDEAERSLAEGWAALEGAIQQEVEGRCLKSDRCRAMVNRIRDYEIRRFLRANFEEKVKRVGSAIKRVLPGDLISLAKEFKAAHDYEKKVHFDHDDEEEEEEYMTVYRRQKEVDGEQMTTPMYIKHSARLLKMAQPELTATVMKHLNHMAGHFDYDPQEEFPALKKKKDVDWREVRGDIYDMAADIIETQSKKAEEAKEAEKKQDAAPWSIWTSGFGSGNGSGSSANNYADYSKYASKWSSQQQQKDQKKEQAKKNIKKGGYYYDEVDEPSKYDIDEENQNQWIHFSPKRGEFFYGKQPQQPQQPQLLTAY